MEHFVQISRPEELESFVGTVGLQPISPEEFIQHAPDVHWILIRHDQGLAGHCSLWWRNVPPYPGQQLGLVGHYAVQDELAARALLQHANQQLAGEGCTLAVAPIDGNTWRRYRFITERGDEPNFFLEPDNPDDWPIHFVNQGFKVFARYSSALNTDLRHVDPRLAGVAERMKQQGVRIRTLDVERFQDELKRIYAITIASFRDNFLYTPIGETEFFDMYRKMLPYLQPEMVLVAEQEGRSLGFLFALPDLLQARRKEPVNTVIIKTFAVLPGRAHGGLGCLLLERAHAIARELGYSRAIHALMHDANPSRKISDRYARTMRRYALFCKEIGR